ncbi:MAG: glutamine--tRNA ligase/YqeY domain fusion protein [Christensenellaceae bacterium]|jgi:glutaminyl-tRNA synthetase|nr:glutamine--tRNA ligase/YqeY domain fusion protein [Christensenellaceae bacterium]
MQEAPKSRSFIEEFIEQDLTQGKVKGAIQTRFPPEPNGYLHIGHVKALYINFTMAGRFAGKCNLRFDDTNPTKEDTEYVEAIKDDIRWLGFKWDKLVYGSDYFEKTYEIAEDFINKGLAYVDELTQAQMREYRGTLTAPGRNSPYRDRSAEESLDLFRRMRAGEFANGRMVLRAKIDMASPNVLLRDPALYRILHARHHNTGDKWCIYPMYDFAHPIQDMIEGITHSLCSLEYEIHRPLYDWVRDHCSLLEAHPRQIEFARLHMSHTVLSKRYLRALVENGYVSGWDDPRMPTLAALRRRGYSAASIHDFLARVGISKADSIVDIRLLEHCVREDLNASARRAMAVLEPLKVTLSNWPEGKTTFVSAENHPDHPEWGAREIPFGKTLYIEREDFAENPPPKFFRLAPGREVRLKSAYIIRCDEVVKNEDGEVIELICSVDLSSLSGGEGANRKVKGTLHWVEAQSAIPFEGRLYDYMFGDAEPAGEPEESADEGEESAPGAKPDFLTRFNHDSIQLIKGFLEPSLGELSPGQSFQFMRQGYFYVDPDSKPGALVFNRTVSLKDSYRP